MDNVNETAKMVWLLIKYWTCNIVDGMKGVDSEKIWAMLDGI